MPKVLNKKTATKEELENAVYVGRPSQYGNPFRVGRHGTRDEVVAKHKEWIKHLSPASMKILKEQLRGKDLVCWCAPLPCHADTLLEIANE